jgi:hypothetical protein
MSDEPDDARRQGWRERCTLSAEERAFLRGDGTVAYARKLVFAGAAAGAAAGTAMALGFPLPGLALAVDPRLLLAAAGLYLVLGALARRGQGWASLGLMALLTASLVLPNVTAAAQASFLAGDHPGFWACRLIVCGLGWAMWMRFYWLAWRVERRQAAMEGAAL